MPILLDGYNANNSLTYWRTYAGSYYVRGQSFTSVAGRLETCKFRLSRMGSPTGSVYAKLYAHTGTYGTTSRGTGDALATSDAINITSIASWSDGLHSDVTFAFSGANKVSLSAGYYVIVVYFNGGDVTNCLMVNQNEDSPTHDGSACAIWNTDTGWTISPTRDQFFYVYGTTIPTTTTSLCTNVSFTTATANGNITYIGGENATRRGFCYKTGTTGDPTTADSTAYDDGDFGTGVFTKGLTSLTSGEDYRVRAYAVNSVGTSYGTTVQLTMLQAGAPELTTTAATNILYESATLGGNVTDVGTPELTERGVAVWTTGAETEYMVAGTSGAFTKDLTELTDNTTYYFKAFATNTEGQSYGDTLTFTTAQYTPVVGQTYAIPVFRKS